MKLRERTRNNNKKYSEADDFIDVDYDREEMVMDGIKENG